MHVRKVSRPFLDQGAGLMQVQYATLTTFTTHYTRYTLYTVYYLLCIASSGPRRAGPTGAGLGACMGLSTLSLCRNAVGDRGAEAIAAGMRSHSAGLFYLSIYSIYLSCPFSLSPFCVHSHPFDTHLTHGDFLPQLSRVGSSPTPG
jgi:hypothetical protein